MKYFLWIIASLRLCVGQNDEPCVIAGERGACVPLSDCEQYVTLLKDPTTTFQGLQVTRARQCGFVGMEQKVCCPEHDAPAIGKTNEDSDDFVDEFPNIVNCGKLLVPKAPFVFNGMPVTERSMVKWIALLGYKDSLSLWQCGGSVITSRHVLTAAHCVKRNLYIVRLGELDVGKEEEDHSPIDFYVKKAIRHEQYTKYHNDIAVLVLEGTIDFNKYYYIEPICLPIPNPDLMLIDTKETFVTGWGETEKPGQRSNQLLYAYLNILDRNVCAHAYSGRNVTIDERVLCAGDSVGEHDACNGDSGGPLIHKYNITDYGFTTTHHYQVGIVSYGFRCSARRFMGVYTNVAYFLPWLEEKVLGKRLSRN